MKHITATTAFRNAAEAISLRIQDFAPVPNQPNIWRLSALSEEVRSIVRSYNTEDDKYPEVLREFKSERLGLRYDAGPELFWIKGSPYLPDGRAGLVGVCIVLPRPENVQNERKIAGCPGSVDDALHQVTEQQKTSSDLAATLEPTGTAELPTINLGQVEIGQVIPGGGGPSVMARAQLGAGDIIVLNPHEYLGVGAGGIAMIFIRYKICQLHEMGQ